MGRTLIGRFVKRRPWPLAGVTLLVVVVSCVLVATGFEGGESNRLDRRVFLSEETGTRVAVDPRGDDNATIGEAAEAGAQTSGLREVVALSWDEVLLPSPTPNSRANAVVRLGDGSLLAAGWTSPGGPEYSDAAVWTSADPTRWSFVKIPGGGGDGAQGIRALHVMPDEAVVAVGQRGIDMGAWRRDPDGEWHSVDPGRREWSEGQQAWDICLQDKRGTLVAVGWDANRASAWTSRDGGQTWVEASEGLEAGRGGLAAALGVSCMRDGRIVAVGFDAAGQPSDGLFTLKAVAWTSEDAVHWERVEPAGKTRGTALFDVVEGNDGRIVAVGMHAGDALNIEPSVWTSPDGKAWGATATLPSPYLHATMLTVIPLADHLLAASQGGVFPNEGGHPALYSTSASDASAWTELPFVAPSTKSIYIGDAQDLGNGAVLLTGGYGLVFEAGPGAVWLGRPG